MLEKRTWTIELGDMHNTISDIERNELENASTSAGGQKRDDWARNGFESCLLISRLITFLNTCLHNLLIPGDCIAVTKNARVSHNYNSFLHADRLDFILNSFPFHLAIAWSQTSSKGLCWYLKLQCNFTRFNASFPSTTFLNFSIESKSFSQLSELPRSSSC